PYTGFHSVIGYWLSAISEVARQLGNSRPLSGRRSRYLGGRPSVAAGSADRCSPQGVRRWRVERRGTSATFYGRRGGRHLQASGPPGLPPLGEVFLGRSPPSN